MEEKTAVARGDAMECRAAHVVAAKRYVDWSSSEAAATVKQKRWQASPFEQCPHKRWRSQAFRFDRNVI